MQSSELVPALDTLVDAAAHAIDRSDWPAFRSAVAALREQLSDDDDPRVREILDGLAAVSPAHDPDGCRRELGVLGEILRTHPRSGSSPRMLPPLVDLRGLEPPQPIVRILDALEHDPDAPLRVVLPHEPQPLYGLLRQKGFEWSGAARADGGFELIIRRS